MIKPDGLCGLRVIFMYKKFIQCTEKQEYPLLKDCDVDLTIENNYNEFFNWIKSKYDVAVKVMEDLRQFCIINKIEPHFASGHANLPTITEKRP